MLAKLAWPTAKSKFSDSFFTSLHTPAEEISPDLFEHCTLHWSRETSLLAEVALYNFCFLITWCPRGDDSNRTRARYLDKENVKLPVSKGGETLDTSFSPDANFPGKGADGNIRFFEGRRRRFRITRHRVPVR
ncbi:hypothetical protein CEXT_467811 [Caerostris extrusa]|uniref:Uncharacterized protein n=1 Tax=Caerostris extrusa TaxID=172846 RepID=A0AAV4MPX8_CAEEX|nr:hypothetical protein CEXT_467811 [Caerostris extrusa]